MQMSHSLYAYKHASSFYCRRGIAFSFFCPSMIISLLSCVSIVTLVVNWILNVVSCLYHVMLSLPVLFSFLSVIFLGTSSEVLPIPLAFLVYQSWPLGDGVWFTGVGMVKGLLGLGWCKLGKKGANLLVVVLAR